MSEYKYELDTQSRLVEAKREAKREERRKRDREIARNFKKLGISVEQIAQGTGLTEQQINEL
jgi:predicted transposase/invertase (TIGR01784 family)